MSRFGLYHCDFQSYQGLELGEGNTFGIACALNRGDLYPQTKEQHIINDYESFYFPLMRLIGKSLDDPYVQDYIKSAPFPVAIDDNNQPNYVVAYGDKEESFSLVEIMAVILCKIKRAMLRVVGKTESEDDQVAVALIVPSDFGQEQRHHLEVAANLAKLNITHMISPATAVAHFFNTLPSTLKDGRYDHQALSKSKLRQSGNFLFLHLSALTLNISVISVDEENETMEIKSGIGNSQLGGEQLMERLKSFAPDEFSEGDFQTACRALMYNEVGFVTRDDDETFDSLEMEFICLRDHEEEVERNPDSPESIELKKTLEQRRKNYKAKKLKFEQEDCYHLTRQMVKEQCADQLDEIRQTVAKAIDEAGDDYRLVQMFGRFCHMPHLAELVGELLPDVELAYFDLPEQQEIEKWDWIEDRFSLPRIRDYELEGGACLSFIRSNRGKRTFTYPRWQSRDQVIRECPILSKNMRLLNESDF